MNKLNLRAYILVYYLLLGISSVCGQQASKAAEILDKTAVTFMKGNGIYISFTGSQNGILQLQDNKYHLICGGMESWFDGKTQWSYVAKNEEITISTPTLEEVQEMNPCNIFRTYKKRFRYAYKGTKTLQGRKNHEIELIPINALNNEISVVLLYITDSYIPQNITLKMKNGYSQIFKISSFQIGKKYDEKTFCFNQDKYPKTEIIDLR